MKKIINEYPAHDYIIDYKELKDIGFDVGLPSKKEKPLLEKIVEYIRRSSQTEVLFIDEEDRPDNIRKAKSGKKEGGNK